MFIIERDEHNPILSPKSEHDWEAAGAFNWCPVENGDSESKKITAVYRAQSNSEFQDGVRRSVSSIGLAESEDGFHFARRRQFIVPEKEWEKFGCEDPRVTKLGNEYYIFYTALSVYPFRAEGIRVALAKADKNMCLLEKHPVTPFNAKAMALFPQKIGGKFAALLSVKTDQPPSAICYAEFENESDIWSPEFWKNWQADIASHTLSVRRSDNEQVELGTSPILTSAGWLVLYSHINGYFRGNRTFGVEALLLDLKNPRTIIGRTKGAFLVPEEYYERVGQVPKVVFPSGARVRGGLLEIYYGAADTHSCLARVNLKKLLKALLEETQPMKRSPHNPILSPRPGLAFEELGVFNPAAVDIGGKVRLLYRATAKNNVSTFGYAESQDGLAISERLDKPVYAPRADFEKRGCEDPRATLIGDKVIILYTAYDGSVPRVAVTGITVKNLLNREWLWDRPRLLSFSSAADKDASILPRKIGGKYMVIHRLDNTICADFINSLEWKEPPVRTCIPIIEPRPGMWDGGKVGLACPPFETKRGWLLFYHGVSSTTHYRLGVALLDRADPTIVLARSAAPIFEPVEEYELRGVTPAVVFPCGLVERRGKLFLYYGAADSVVGVAIAKISEILSILSLR